MAGGQEFQVSSSAGQRRLGIGCRFGYRALVKRCHAFAHRQWKGNRSRTALQPRGIPRGSEFVAAQRGRGAQWRGGRALGVSPPPGSSGRPVGNREDRCRGLSAALCRHSFSRGTFLPGVRIVPASKNSREKPQRCLANPLGHQVPPRAAGREFPCCPRLAWLCCQPGGRRGPFRGALSGEKLLADA